MYFIYGHLIANTLWIIQTHLKKLASCNPMYYLVCVSCSLCSGLFGWTQVTVRGVQMLLKMAYPALHLSPSDSSSHTHTHTHTCFAILVRTMTTEHVVRTPVSANTRRMKKIVLPQGGSRQTENHFKCLHTWCWPNPWSWWCCEDQMVARQKKTVNINGF